MEGCCTYHANSLGVTCLAGSDTCRAVPCEEIHSKAKSTSYLPGHVQLQEACDMMAVIKGIDMGNSVKHFLNRPSRDSGMDVDHPAPWAQEDDGGLGHWG